MSFFLTSGAFASDDINQADSHSSPHGGGLGERLPLWSVIPFVGILLSIAIFPLVAPTFWHHHYPKISFAWALIFGIPFVIFYGSDAVHEIIHIYVIDYIPFIILLWGLFTASGGIVVKGSLAGTPRVNVVILLIGTILASWMGTTGASMALIRPLIRANRTRRFKVHTVVFFIFLVSNIGGSLTPLGDPPLFLGFLHGVPFFWTFNIFPHMLITSVILLILYFIIDTILFRKEAHDIAKYATDDEESKEEGETKSIEPISVHGLHNVIFLAGIMGAVLLSGIWKGREMNVLGIHVGIQNITRDVLIILMGMFSLWTTNRKLREENGFTWFPITEVAYLFAGIFMCIIPALAMLRAGTSGELAFIIRAVKEPAHYFWITGSLSAFLDNAPTYLTFFNLSLGKLGIPEPLVTGILTGAQHPQAETFITYLKAISAGAVFFGAMTYIGNAPNFMVRSISEESKIKMPSFFGFMLWSVGILAPIFILVTLLFF
ncbi:MAG: sodium:proton antiporter [candidate division Zixibacteria bacterium]|nr:sodium:proton antiporter [candidate division Zixibacteria bacterium]